MLRAPADTVRLLARIARDAERSNPLLGDNFDRISPLGSLRPDAIGRWTAREDLVAAIAAGDGRPTELRLSQLAAGNRTGHAMSLGVSGSTRAAVGFSGDAFLCMLEKPEAITIDVTAALSHEFEERALYDEVFAEVLPGQRVRRKLVFRVSGGTESFDIDGAVGFHDGKVHLDLRAFASGGPIALAGRVLYVVGQLAVRDRPDPTRTHRLNTDVFYLREHDIPVTPDLRESKTVDARPIVAVHGTMASAVGLAECLRAWNPARPVYRFEHDTWQTIASNAKELAGIIEEAGISDVIFVAHSRGGLVVHAALELLRNRGVSLRAQAITLGTPSRGTEVVVVAAGALMASGWALGALNHTGIPGISIGTRLASFILGSRLPTGIASMAPNAEFIETHRDCLDHATIAVGGEADLHSSMKHYGLTTRNLLRATNAAFAGPNDFIVSSESAMAGVDVDRTLLTDASHSGYLGQDRVKSLLTAMTSVGLRSWRN